ncbi:hypothetical protein [Burkholderia gladioli]|uniref:hypothetical protein n=1 Tax=Burkholderia gladioli TaxID=28095 RepID=UPI00163E6B24|nr:hypothetical protein [Burkholderia gladioli]
MKKLNMRVVAAATCAAASLLGGAGVAHAASASSSFLISMPVSNPTCTVTNSNSGGTARIALPSASSQTLGATAYVTAQYPTAAVLGGTWYTSSSASYQQTATVACSVQNTAILSFAVQPGPSASVVSGKTGQQYLIDTTSPTPVKAASGNILMGFEQVSVNGTSALYSYQTTAGVIQPYTTAFGTNTVSGSDYAATVVWRPTVSAGGSTVAIGNPTGGKFSGTAQIVANF